LLRRLESGTDIQGCWQELWQGLYHQGDVGEASYAAVPHMVRIYQNRGKIDWNTYAIVTSIELARNVGKNPDVPSWLLQGYEDAINSLAMTGLGELPHANEKESIRSILAVIAIWKEARRYARIIIDYSEDELNELENKGSIGDK
ncbi:MAG: hypothetical protein WA970_14695, partial [Gammaproteobacteria bacterium]